MSSDKLGRTTGRAGARAQSPPLSDGFSQRTPTPVRRTSVPPTPSSLSEPPSHHSTLAGAPSLGRLATGEAVFLFDLEVRAADGRLIHVRQRYSNARLLYRQIAKLYPAECSKLPPFPPKSSLSRQTPTFLRRRGEALGAFLEAVLANPTLAALPATNEFLVGGSFTCSPAPPVSATEYFHAPSPSSGGGSAPASPTVAVAAQTSGGLSTPLRAPASKNTSSDPLPPEWRQLLEVSSVWQPVALALALSFVLGLLRNQPTLAVSCFLLGLVAGITFAGNAFDAGAKELEHAVSVRRSRGRDSRKRSATIAGSAAAARSAPVLAPKLSPEPAARQTNSAHFSAAVGGDAVGTPLLQDAGAIVTDEAPGSVVAVPPSLTTMDPLEATAAAIAREGLEVLADGIKLDSEKGWRKWSRRDHQDVWVNSNMGDSIPMASLGVGDITKPLDQVEAFLSNQALRAKYDTQWLRTERLQDVPMERLEVAGWRAIRLSIDKSLFKSPAPFLGIAPRESVVVAVTAVCVADGTVRHVQRSIEMPQVPIESGYVRMKVLCGGYQLRAVSGELTQVHYLTIVDPAGRLPKSVVNTTMPDRAMSIARARRVMGQLDQVQITP